MYNLNKDKVFRTIFGLIHHNNVHESMKKVLIFLILINKIQELYLIVNGEEGSVKNDMINIVWISRYVFVIKAITNTQIIIIIIGFFIKHIIFVLIFIYIYFSQTKSQIINSFIHYYITYYMLLIYLPSIYAAFFFINQDAICNKSDICDSTLKIILYIFCVINISISLTINIIHSYFCRANSLMEDNNILLQHHSLIYHLIKQCSLLTIIILNTLNYSSALRFGFYVLQWILTMIFYFNQQNIQVYILIDTITLGTSFSLLFSIGAYEYLIIISLLIYIYLQVSEFISDYYVVMRNQENLITLQKIEQANQLETSVKNKFSLTVIKRIHSCKKCKYNQHITECILKKMANKTMQNKNQMVIFYCQFIGYNAPLKALIRLLLMKPTNLYYRCSAKYLADKLAQRAHQFQNDLQMRTASKYASEHSNSLDVQTVFQTFHSATELFPCLIDAIQAKINFWTKLINGYTDINMTLDDAIKTSIKIQKCKTLIEQRFDLQQNKMNNVQGTDIISLRVIQIFHCCVYTNSFQSFQIEKIINDLLKSERFKQDDSLDNIQLAQDRLIILKSSLVNKRGELKELNLIQLSKFLNVTEEEVRIIKTCNQLMPNFLSNIHDKFFDNYIYQGNSKLMVKGEQTFIQNIQGYLEPISINLYNFFDGKDDFLINMILTKDQLNSETILFAVDGRILGVTTQFFDIVIQSKILTITKGSTQKDSFGIPKTILEFLDRGPLIQYFIPNIMNQVQELKNQIISSMNYQMNNLKSSWITPNNYIDCLASTYILLQQFKRKSQGSKNFQSYKSQSFSRYTNQSQTHQDNYDESEISRDILKNIVVDNIPLIILHPDLKQSITELTHFQDSINEYVLFYSLQFKVIKYKGGQYGYFMLNIKEFKSFDVSQSQNLTKLKNGSTSKSNKSLVSNINEFSDQITQHNSMFQEIPQQENELIQEIKQMNNLFLNEKEILDQSNQISSLDQSNTRFQGQIKMSDRSNIFDSSRGIIQRQPLFAKINIYEQNQIDDIDQLEIDMKQIQQYNPGEFDENEQNEFEQANKKIESNSQSGVKKKSYILEKFRLTQKQKLENVEFASNPSRTSTNSTSKESVMIVQQLYFNTALITPLKKISFILILICIGILTSQIINVFLIKINLANQTEQVSNLIKPQNIIYYYTSILYQFWAQMLSGIDIFNLSEFQSYRNTETLANMMNYGRTYLQDLDIQVPITAATLNMTTFNISYVKDENLVNESYLLQNFYAILYEVTVQQYLDNVNLTDQNYSILLTTGVVRQNFLQLIDLHNDLIVSITNDTIYQQSLVSNQFLMNMLIEMFIIILFILFQLRYWLFIDHITKSIIFLVSRINENQSLDQINKLNSAKTLLINQTSSEWKLNDFGDIMFEKSDRKIKKQILIQQDQNNKNQNSYKSTGALYSRIQNPAYVNKINIILTVLLILLWCLFLIVGYIVHMQRNDNFQPSLIATLKYGQFRLNMDSVGFIGGIVKSENLVPNNNQSYINQSYAISLLLELKENLSPLINEVAQVILENAITQGKTSRFDSILNYDICEFTAWDEMQACNLSKQDLSYYDSDSINAIVQNGVLGYTSALVKYLDSDFNYEFTNMNYDTIENNEYAITQQPFENFFLSYYCDIQNTMLAFLNLFQLDNSEIADEIINIIQIYYLGVGIILFIFISSMNFIWVYKTQQKIICLRQILVLIPSELILTSNIRSQAKEIHNWLY